MKGDNRIMKTSIALMALSIPVAAYSATTHRDPRTRELVDPVRIVATSFWEDFDLAWTNNAFRIDEMRVAGKKDVHGDYGAYCYVGFRHSLCHGWSSGPAPWLVEHVLGIRPLDVGCRIIEVKPDLGDLEWAEGAMALPGGRSVRVRVSRCRDGTLKVEVDAPDGIKVVVPGQGSISAEGR